MRKLLPPLLLLLLLLSGCRQGGEPVRAAMPAEMPADFAFSVKFGITARNEINTFDGTVTKDLISDGTASADLNFTASELVDIYAKMRELEVMGNMQLDTNTLGCAQVPYEEEHWRIRVNGEEVQRNWSQERCKLTEDAVKLKELRQYIFELVQARPEYLQLPDAEGGYE